ncbi:MAG: VCBS repeat-containing protein [Acidobacteria bacterium]|nr:VCBS repeat-containing protein [Acidobacteriota bacterium]
MGSGVAMFDYDNDGRLDLFLVKSAALADPMPAGREPDKSDQRFWNRLFHNNGDGTFTDVTERAGLQGHSYGMGVAAGDYDNDGHSDLYVTNFGRREIVTLRFTLGPGGPGRGAKHGPAQAGAALR